MIVLDENVFASQRERLLGRRVHLCQIGCDVGRKGLKDNEIIPLLRQLRRPTFVTRDRDFFRKTLCNDKMCLTFLDVRPLEVADYTRRVLRNPRFKTWSQRKGCVMRVSPSGVSVWRVRTRLCRYGWDD